VFPGKLKNCEGCHLPDTYNFGASASAAALPNMLLKTVAKGFYNNTAGVVNQARTFDANGVDNNGGSTSPVAQTAAAADAISPYVTADNVTGYGIGFSYTAYRAAAAAKAATATSIALPAVVSETAVTRPAAATTLVNSQIASPCFSCHDTDAAKAHMKLNGGSIYTDRATALKQSESCLVCHGAGKEFDIKAMHAK
jgi:OmcA/MtrC family decaheme c-type cytochrome